MIRVTIELIPQGDESRKKNLGVVEIANDGQGTQTHGNYMVKLSKFGKPTHTWIKGIVQNFPRKTKGPYDLLLQALIATVGHRNKKTISLAQHLQEELEQKEKEDIE
jgi:hypothetical protein